MSKQIAKSETKSTIPAEVLADFQADAGAGFEEATKDSFAIPFLAILQPLSPAVQPGAGKVPGAEVGKIINTVTKRCCDELRVIPVHYTRTFVEWVPRDEGGGFVAEYDQETGLELYERCEIHPKTKARLLPNGNVLNDNRNHYVVVLNDDGSFEPALISMTSSQIKKSRQWMTIMNNTFLNGSHGQFRAPMFSHIYRLKSTQESNDKGTWYGWAIEREEMVADTLLYNQSKGFRNSITAGKIETDRAGADEVLAGEQPKDDESF